MSEVSIAGRFMSREPARWGFASPGPLRDKLTALAFGGGKVVTTGLLAEYEIEGDPVEQPGDVAVLLDSAESPVALIEDVLSKVIRLADMTDVDAIDEDEDYADAAAFRVAHERHWAGFIDEVRAGLGDPTYTITDDTPVVVERFRIVAVLAADGSPITPLVRPAYPVDRQAVDAFLAEHNAELVARRGELVDARGFPALIVVTDGRIDGVLTWILAGGSMEVLTLHAATAWAGVGTALIAAARRIAEASGAGRLWLITTNDNVDALRFYQRRGFRLSGLDSGAVDRSRATLKPAIPEVGAHEVPLRDELELEMRIGGEAHLSPTDPVATLFALELALARRDEASIPGGYEAVLAPGFSEIGASGRLWTRAEILAAVGAEPAANAISIEAFEIHSVTTGVVLATFDTTSPGPDGVVMRRRRSSLWIRANDRWQVRFHQGTPVPDGR